MSAFYRESSEGEWGMNVGGTGEHCREDGRLSWGGRGELWGPEGVLMWTRAVVGNT